MPYTCQNCAKRKVKCDKVTPICLSCRRAKLTCSYEAPQPRGRKRKPSGDRDEKLELNERLLRRHGLLSQDPQSSPSTEDTPQEPVTLFFNGPETSRLGKLVTGQGKSRYIDSNLWRHLGDDEIQRIPDNDEGDDAAIMGAAGNFTPDPLTTAFMGFHRDLLDYHPTHAVAKVLLKTHLENVEPVCKILHIPTAYEMFESVSQQPEAASRADECLVFAIYHFAIYAMSEAECDTTFGQARGTLLQKYHFAARQALVNASFLKTTEVSILQALVLFLLPCRDFYDTNTYWILTGVAVRIAQRMGLHRDGEDLGLPPFDVEVRRRLFYQVIPLDGVASQLSGAGMGMNFDSWDTLPPRNINDDQIWPGMTEPPKEQAGATDMIFCSTRSCVGQYFAKTGKLIHGGEASKFKDYHDLEPIIVEAEREVEEKYIRYCDIVNPLHFLAIGLARSAICAMRLRARLSKVRNNTVTDPERKEIFHLAQRIMDTNIATFAHTSARKYQWNWRSFFAWGSWDSLIFVLTTLSRADLLSPAQVDAAWGRVEQLYANNIDLLECKRPLQLGIGRLSLKAWHASPPTTRLPEPDFITTLRSLQRANIKGRPETRDNNPSASEAQSQTASSANVVPTSDANDLLGSMGTGIYNDLHSDFNIDSTDWMFWDRLIQDFQAQGG